MVDIGVFGKILIEDEKDQERRIKYYKEDAKELMELMVSSDTKLSPCPFCGGSAAYYCDNYGGRKPVHYAACTKCGAEGIGRISDKFAKEEWNARASDTQIESLTAQLEEAKMRIEELENAVMDMGLKLVKYHIEDNIDVYKRLANR